MNHIYNDDNCQCEDCTPEHKSNCDCDECKFYLDLNNAIAEKDSCSWCGTNNSIHDDKACELNKQEYKKGK